MGMCLAVSLRMSACPRYSMISGLWRSPPENQACYKSETFLGEVREIYAVPAGNLPAFSQRYRLLDALILGSRISPFVVVFFFFFPKSQYTAVK